MTPKQPKQPSIQRPKMKRTHRISFTLNDEEKRVFDFFVDKYLVTNRSRYVREVLIHNVLQQLDEDRPTLFD